MRCEMLDPVLRISSVAGSSEEICLNRTGSSSGVASCRMVKQKKRIHVCIDAGPGAITRQVRLLRLRSSSPSPATWWK